MQWLVDVLNGEPGPEATEHLRRAFITWWQSGGRGRRDADGRLMRSGHLSLARCAGLPENPENARLQLRNWYLRQAAELLDAPIDQPWRRATELHAALVDFAGRKWPCWWSLSEPPMQATELESLLWHATRAGGGRLPGTARRIAQILEA